MSEIPGQSGHALPDLQPPVCASNGNRYLRRGAVSLWQSCLADSFDIQLRTPSEARIVLADMAEVKAEMDGC